jgi:Uri superfamily endonuclease
MTQKFKMAFENYTDAELLDKKIQFEALKESHEKGYYTYQGSVLISGPEDLEHRILRPNHVKVLEG